MSVFKDIPSQTSPESFIQPLVDKAILHPEFLNELWQFGLTSDPAAWKALWVMDKIHDTRPDLIQPFLRSMLENIEKLKQSGQKRHILKLLSLNPLPVEPTGSFIDYCFNILQSRIEPAAVRVHAMQMLYSIALTIPEFRNELRIVIEEVMIEGTPGIISRGKKILQIL